MGKFIAKKGSIAMKKCAFCRYYYDPTNTVINPKRGMPNCWEYETAKESICTARNNRKTWSQNVCSKYECKL